jgi:hypothetical protein
MTPKHFDAIYQALPDADIQLLIENGGTGRRCISPCRPELSALRAS